MKLDSNAGTQIVADVPESYVVNGLIDEDEPGVTLATGYYSSLTTLRLICVVMMILNFTIQLSSQISLVYLIAQPVLNTATCVLFAIFGFLLYQSGAVNYRKHILRLLLSFLVLLAIYYPLSIAYEWLMYGTPSQVLDIRHILEFLTVSVWPSTSGGSIWLVQSTLYAVLILSLLDRFHLLSYDWFICSLLLVFAFLTGEGSGIFHFNFFGYRYVPICFLTQALPYMLIGRIVGRYREKFETGIAYPWVLLLSVSLIISYGEVVGIMLLKYQRDLSQLLGFAPLTFAVMVLSIRKIPSDQYLGINEIHRRTGYYMYAMYSPLVTFFILLANWLQSYSIIRWMTPIVLVLSLAGGFGLSFWRVGRMMNEFAAEHPELYSEEMEEEEENYET